MRVSKKREQGKPAASLGAANFPIFLDTPFTWVHESDIFKQFGVNVWPGSFQLLLNQYCGRGTWRNGAPGLEILEVGAHPGPSSNFVLLDS